ncbi:MAG: N-acetylmuramoyl-L-alanine amidase [Longimicrobiales bacterium]
MIRRIALAAFIATTSMVFVVTAAAPVYAQSNALRVDAGSGVRSFAGVRIDGAVTYPVTVMEQLGGSIRSVPGGAVIRIGGDSVRFWSRSPFFTAGNRINQLAFNAEEADGVLRIPEQFFVQTLPAMFGNRFEYRGGTLYVKGGTPVAAQTAPAAPAPADTNARPGERPTPTPPPALPNPNDRRAAAAPGTGKRIVIIDPGHGGVDPGSEGPNKLPEKQAVLTIANRLAALLRTRDYEVHMTRTRDTLIALADRPRMANRWKGDEPGALFISIHANSLKLPQARGFETFFLSDANTADELRVAEMENAAVKYEAKPKGNNSELDQVLNGLRNDFYLRASNDFAGVVQKQLGQFHPGPNRGVKRAPFRVLVGALMPAVLVEVAFISNPGEAGLLGTAEFQDKLAFSLAASVDTFFRENEPLWRRQ